MIKKVQGWIKCFFQKCSKSLLFLNDIPHQRRAVMLLKLVGGRFRVLSQVALVDLAFRGFLQNSRKYRLESLRKTPKEGTLPIGLCPPTGKFTLNLQPNPTIFSTITKNIRKYVFSYYLFKRSLRSQNDKSIKKITKIISFKFYVLTSICSV